MRFCGDILIAFIYNFVVKLNKKGIFMTYTEEYLKELSIHTLRTLGKMIGVKSPTSLHKNQLIKEIVGISNGEIAPFFSKKGRPTLDNNCTDILKLKKILTKLTTIEHLACEIKKDIEEVLSDK